MKTSSTPRRGPQEEDIVTKLHQHLGMPVVFIAWPKGCKAAKKPWGHLTVAHMTPEYLAKLSQGNIGVVMGEKSGGLCVIDCDTDEFAKSFLGSNPQLEGTLRTHGARGCAFWVRFTGDYPKRSSKLKSRSGVGVGEFRSNGNQSIVWGIHPDTLKPYQFVVDQPVVGIDYSKINWPTEVINPLTLKGSCTDETEATEVTEVTEELTSSASVPSASSVSSVQVQDYYSPIHSIEDALLYSLPKRTHENNDRLFDYARALKGFEMHRGSKLTQAELRNVFEQWHARATQYLRPEQSKDDYLMEFLSAYQRAKYGVGGEVIAKAWRLAKEQALPPEAMEFEDPQKRLVIALCYQLQVMAGSEPFFLSARTCQGLLGQRKHSTAATWLSALCGAGILKEVKKGSGKKASRYRYLSTVASPPGTV